MKDHKMPDLKALEALILPDPKRKKKKESKDQAPETEKVGKEGLLEIVISLMPKKASSSSGEGYKRHEKY